VLPFLAYNLFFFLFFSSTHFQDSLCCPLASSTLIRKSLPRFREHTTLHLQLERTSFELAFCGLRIPYQRCNITFCPSNTHPLFPPRPLFVNRPTTQNMTLFCLRCLSSTQTMGPFQFRARGFSHNTGSKPAEEEDHVHLPLCEYPLNVPESCIIYHTSCSLPGSARAEGDRRNDQTTDTYSHHVYEHSSDKSMVACPICSLV